MGAPCVGGEIVGERDLGAIAGVGRGALLFMGLLLALVIASRGGMGGGDVRLALLLGANLGYHGVLAVPMALSMRQ